MTEINTNMIQQVQQQKQQKQQKQLESSSAAAAAAATFEKKENNNLLPVPVQEKNQFICYGSTTTCTSSTLNRNEQYQLSNGIQHHTNRMMIESSVKLLSSSSSSSSSYNSNNQYKNNNIINNNENDEIIEYDEFYNPDNNTSSSTTNTTNFISKFIKPIQPTVRIQSVYTNIITVFIVVFIWSLSLLAVFKHQNQNQNQNTITIPTSTITMEKEQQQQQQEHTQVLPIRYTIDQQIDILESIKSQWDTYDSNVNSMNNYKEKTKNKQFTSFLSDSMLLSSIVTNTATATATATATSTSTSTGAKTIVDPSLTIEQTTTSSGVINDASTNISGNTNIYLNTSTAFAMLLNTTTSNTLDGMISSYSSDYFTITTSGWEAQINQAYCGVASTAAILNSYREILVSPSSTATTGTSTAPTGTTIESYKYKYNYNYNLPIDEIYAPYKYATQIDILNNTLNTCVGTNVIIYNTTYDGIFTIPGGLSLYQVQDLLECHLQQSLTSSNDKNDNTIPKYTVKVQQVHSSLISVDQVRNELLEALYNPYKRIIINYNRLQLYQYGGGHFSPIGSYNVEKDMFLVLDVAKYKYPPVWVSTTTLYQAMSAIDQCGIWNYPYSQLSSTVVQYTTNNKNYWYNQTLYYELLSYIGCTSTYRGYVISEIVV